MQINALWSPVIGHQWAIDLLTKTIKNQRIGHAYLFTGPKQIGKATLARTFAMTLNCEQPNAPCGNCRSCTLIGKGKHPDVIHLDPEISGRGKATLKIGAVRDLQRSLQLASYESKYKIAILSDFDAATIGAANAFLKTLEEPPSNVILLLTAGNADALLDTIRSRCRELTLRPLSQPMIQQALQDRLFVQESQASLLAHLANGRMGWAIRAIEDEGLLTERTTHLTFLQNGLATNRVGRFKLSAQIAKDPEAIPDLLQTWISWWRDLLLLTHGSSAEQLTNIDTLELLQTKQKQWSEDEILTALQETRLALKRLGYNVNLKLLLENLFLTYPY